MGIDGGHAEPTRLDLRSMLRLHEGLRLKPYPDSKGITTIGYGHNLIANPLPWLNVGPSITRNVAEAIFLDDVDKAQRLLSVRFPWTSDLDEVRRAVLVNMTFNMGIGPPGGLASFVNTLRFIREGNFQQASAGMLLSDWAEDVGVTRSQELAKMMRTGEWPSA